MRNIYYHCQERHIPFKFARDSFRTQKKTPCEEYGQKFRSCHNSKCRDTIHDKFHPSKYCPKCLKRTTKTARRIAEKIGGGF